MSPARVGMLAVDSSRTRAYLAALSRHNLELSCAVYLTGGPGAKGPTCPAVPYFDNLTPALDTLRRMGVACSVLDTGDVNSPGVVEAVRASPADVLIYSGAGGAILRDEILDAGVRFLHVHAGVLPRYRGSTTVYYSLLAEGNCGASALFLDREIDTGPVLATRTYPPPEDRTTIDYGYDPYIRSDLLASVLKEYSATGGFRTVAQNADSGETYYIMHPVLRHTAVLSSRSGS